MDIGRILKLLLIAVAVVLPVRTWVGEPIYVASPSMEPTLRTGTLMMLDKVTLRLRDLHRGDIISFRSPVEKVDMLKRVVALPGETLELRDKKVYINGVSLDEDYAVYSRRYEKLDGDNIGPFVVPKDGVFVLGDNRDESNDSTVWKDVDGKPIYFLSFSLIQGLARRLPWA